MAGTLTDKQLVLLQRVAIKQGQKLRDGVPIQGTLIYKNAATARALEARGLVRCEWGEKGRAAKPTQGRMWLTEAGLDCAVEHELVFFT